jgi:hypothetical protein
VKRPTFKAALIACAVADALMVIWLGVAGAAGAAEAAAEQTWTPDAYRMVAQCDGPSPVYQTPDHRLWVWRRRWAPVDPALMGPCPPPLAGGPPS